MRVLLVRPPGRFRTLTFPDGPMVGPPRALLHLAAAIRHRADVDLRVLDAYAEPDEAALAAFRPGSGRIRFGLAPAEVARRAADFAPDLVGVTVMANYFREDAVALVAAVRAALPEARIVLGGPDPTVDPEGYLADAPADAVCVGEGEATFAELVDRLARGAAWDDVAGLVVRGPSGPRRTAERPLLEDLSGTTPDHGLVDLERYFALAARGWRSRPAFARPGVERAVDLVTSRGCPYRCSFCVIHRSMGRRFRTRPVGDVIAELRVLVERHGVRHVHLEDDVVNLDRRRFRELLAALVEARLPLGWDTPNGVRADLLDEPTARLARAAGCTSTILAVESGVQRVLDEVIDKELDLAAVEVAARACEAAELDALAFYVVGLPGETLYEARATVDVAIGLLERAGVTPLLQVWRPYVGTEAHDRAAAAGLLHPADPLALHAATGIPSTQFRDRAADVLPLPALAELFADYTRRAAAAQLARWRRAGIRWGDTGHPDVGGFLLHTAPFLHAWRRGAAAAPA